MPYGGAEEFDRQQCDCCGYPDVDEDYEGYEDYDDYYDDWQFYLRIKFIIKLERKTNDKANKI